MSVSFGGFNENTATFKTTEDIAKKSAVKMSESNTVAACSGGEPFCGIVTECSGGYASVQLSGTVTAAYSGSVPEVGYTKLAGDGAAVTVSDNGREYLVISVDETAQTVTFLM
ncbi:MAG: hypothetical protein IJO03_03075 [Clostridia bacterium]|nr:hypothetical protein [Clostridia bacterium]MBQ7121227.1 hypothetical protein [Clostridia bacterium]